MFFTYYWRRNKDAINLIKDKSKLVILQSCIMSLVPVDTYQVEGCTSWETSGGCRISLIKNGRVGDRFWGFELLFMISPQ